MMAAKDALDRGNQRGSIVDVHGGGYLVCPVWRSLGFSPYRSRSPDAACCGRGVSFPGGGKREPDQLGLMEGRTGFVAVAERRSGTWA